MHRKKDFEPHFEAWFRLVLSTISIYFHLFPPIFPVVFGPTTAIRAPCSVAPKRCLRPRPRDALSSRRHAALRPVPRRDGSHGLDSAPCAEDAQQPPAGAVSTNENMNRERERYIIYIYIYVYTYSFIQFHRYVHLCKCSTHDYTTYVRTYVDPYVGTYMPASIHTHRHTHTHRYIYI